MSADLPAATTTSSQQPTGKAPWQERLLTGRRAAWLEVALILLVFYVHAGWPAPEVNEPHYLGKAKHYWNPSWCAGDFFLTSADAHQTFYWCFGWLTLLLPLEAVAWTGRWLVWTLLAVAWRRLSVALIPLPLASVLSAALFVSWLERCNLAGEWVVGGVEAKGFAYVLVLCGLRELVLARWNVVWLWFGAAAAWHVLVGGWSVVAGGIAWLLDWRCPRRTPLVRMTPGLVGGFLLSLIGLWPALTLTRGMDAETVAEANRIYVFERLPHHLALHELAPRELQKRLLRNAIMLLAFGGVAWLTLRPRRRRGELPDEPQPAEENNSFDDAALRRLCYFVVATIGFAAAGALISWTTHGNPDLAARLLRYYWYRLYDVALPLGTSLLSVRLLADWLPQRRSLATCLLAGLIGLPVLHLGIVVTQRFYDHRAPADRRVADAADFIAACRWIRAEAPANAVFLTERGGTSFKWYAHRSEVFNQKDIPQDAAGIVAWQARMNDLFPEYQTPEGTKRRSLGRRSEADLLALATRYGASYLMTSKSVPLALPVVYQNATYLIYSLPAGAAPDAQQ